MNYPHQVVFKNMLILIFLCAVTLACTVPGLGEKQPPASVATPVAIISSPTAGEELELGTEIQVMSSAMSSAGIVRTELMVDGDVVWVDANADPQPGVPFIVSQPWTAETPGSHVIQVRAYDKSNVSGESERLILEVLVSARAADDDKYLADTVEPEPPSATATPVSVLADAPPATATLPSTATPQPATPTPTPTIPLPTPTATPTPGTFRSTGLEPEGRLQEIWQELGAGESRLGYPVNPEISDRDYAKQYFENGLMYWWDSLDEPDYIWVIDSPEPDLQRGATSNRYPDKWDGDDEISCEEARANSGKGPARGFGWLWCQRPELRTRLGNPRESEIGSGGNAPYGLVQFFQGGVMLYNPKNAEVYVLFDQGDWRRFQW